MRTAQTLAFLALFAGIGILVVGQVVPPAGFFGAVSPFKLGLGLVFPSCFAFAGYVLYTAFVRPLPFPAPAVAMVSNKATLFIKVFLPYYFLTGWLLSSALTYFSPYSHDLFWPNFLFFSFLTGASVLMARVTTNVFRTADATVLVAKSYRYDDAITLSPGVRHDDFKFVSRLRSEGTSYWYVNKQQWSPSPWPGNRHQGGPE